MTVFHFRRALNASSKHCLWSVYRVGKTDGELVSFPLITLWDQSYWSILSSLSVHCLFEITLPYLSLWSIRQGLQSYLLKRHGLWPWEVYLSLWSNVFNQVPNYVFLQSSLIFFSVMVDWCLFFQNTCILIFKFWYWNGLWKGLKKDCEI